MLQVDARCEYILAMIPFHRIALLGVMVLSLGSVAAAQVRRNVGSSMRSYETAYYIVHSDLTLDETREAAIRMTKMAEEYYNRTRSFSGAIRTKLPFYIFRRIEDYHAAGGVEGSAGMFDGQRLMAIAGEKITSQTWHVIQHEGFHQFAHAVINPNIPTWINEGLAEYFGEAVFTGDQFVSGGIPYSRQQRIKKELETRQFKSFPQIMTLTLGQWNKELSGANYDQAWSMVQFLAHGENGKYQGAFNAFMIDLNRNAPYDRAWVKNFGPADGFEARWQSYWNNLPANSTLNLYMQATASTLASFLGRAYSQKQTFATMDDFLAAAKTNKLKAASEDWLPPGLLAEALENMKFGSWSLEMTAQKLPQVVCITQDKTRVTAGFSLRGSKINKVFSEIDDLPETMDQAKELLARGKKESAAKLLQAGMKQHPGSPHVEEIRQLMADIRKSGNTPTTRKSN